MSAQVPELVVWDASTLVCPPISYASVDSIPISGSREGQIESGYGNQPEKGFVGDDDEQKSSSESQTNSGVRHLPSTQ